VRVRAISLNRGEVRRSTMAAAGWRPGWDLAGHVERAAARLKDHSAILFEGKSVSYATLDYCASALADALAKHGVSGDAAEVHWVPGSFELPQAAQALARTRRFAGVVCVGTVIKGATPHFDYVCGVAAHGISRVGLDTGVPVTFGVITALTEEQAWERAGGVVGNRGEEAALAALEMAGWLRSLRGRKGGR